MKTRQPLPLCHSATLQLLLIFAPLPLCLFLASCSLTPENYIKNYEKNRSRFTQTIERNGIVAKVAYIPNDYYAARDMEADKKLTLNDALKRYENSLFFVLLLKTEKISQKSVLLDGGGILGYKDNVIKNTFEKDRDFFLLNNADTIKVAQFHYDRNWGIGNGDSFILAFPRNKAEKHLEKFHLILRDLVPELGTIDIPVAALVKNTNRLKG